MANTPDYYRKFTITSIPDSATGGFNIPDYERDMKAIVNQAVKSALSEGEFFKTSSRVVNKSTGETRLDVYVHPSDSRVVADSLMTKLEELKYKDIYGRPTTDYKYRLDTDTTDKKETRLIAREENRGTGDSPKATLWTLTKIAGILTTLTDITRRILSSVLSFSTQTVKDMITAHNLGMSYESVRSYKHTEQAHGLKEGTITEAISGEQQKYGNITSLDEKSLEYIALIMGNKVADMATMGIGASNPEAIVEAIVDRANELANSGYNSVGQYVGEQQARRELYSYLLKYSPQIADIFATMQEEQHNINSLYRNQADTFENWKNLVPTSRGDNGWADYGVVTVTGEQWNQVKDMLSQIKEGITVKLADNVLTLLKKIANSRLFLSESEKRQMNVVNKAKNQAELDSINKTLSQYEGSYDNLSVGEKAYYDVLVEQRDALAREIKKETIDDITTVPAELEVRAENRIREGQLKFAEGTSLIIPDISYDEIKEVAKIYNLDTDKARERYRKYREKQVEKAEADIDAYNAKRREDLENEFQENWSPKSYKERNKRFNEAVRGGAWKKAKKSGVLLADLQSLYDLTEIYGFQTDIESEEGDTMSEKVYSALNRAKDMGYGYYDKYGRFQITSNKYVEARYKPLEHLNRELEIEYGNDYYKWLYEQNPYDFNPHVQDYRTEQIINEMRRGSELQAMQWLRETEGTAQDWRNALPASGTYILRGENVQNKGGENVYRVVVDVQDNGKTVSSNVAFSVEGARGYAGVFQGDTVRTGANKNVVWNIETEGTEASVQAPKKK